MKVLIVEDNKPVSLTMARIVEEAGHIAIMAANGERALRLYQQRNPSLMIVDIELPGLDGFQVVQEIRETAGHAMPIIIVSGNAGEAYQQQAKDAGADAFVAKPLRPSMLNELLTKYLPDGD